MFFQLLASSSLLVLVCLLAVFALSILKKDNSIIDSFWGLGFILITIFTLLAGGEITLKKGLMLFLVLLWGLRLSVHIFLRNKNKPEDFRYAEWRRTWKHFYVRSFVQIYLLQGVLMVLIATPLILVNASPGSETGFFTLLGALIFILGFLLEGIADFQLMKFRKNPENQGKLIDLGVWRISRHPNYLGEAILWWGIWLFALPEINGLFTMISPLLITFLVRYVSGVPMLEKKMVGYPGWKEYASRTPVFLPKIRFK